MPERLRSVVQKPWFGPLVALSIVYALFGAPGTGNTVMEMEPNNVPDDAINNPFMLGDDFMGAVPFTQTVGSGTTVAPAAISSTSARRASWYASACAVAPSRAGCRTSADC